MRTKRSCRIWDDPITRPMLLGNRIDSRFLPAPILTQGLQQSRAEWQSLLAPPLPRSTRIIMRRLSISRTLSIDTSVRRMPVP